MSKSSPAFHIAQRAELSRGRAAAFRLLAVLFALGAGALFLLALGYQPLAVYGTMISGALGSPGMQKETLKLTIPLALASFGVLLAFKMRFWNIGAEGQIIMGAVGASYFAYFQNGLPQWALLILMAVFGILVGGLWGLILSGVCFILPAALSVLLFAYGEEGLALGSAFFVVSSMATNTLGAFFAARGNGNARQAAASVLRLPGIYAFLLAMLLRVFDVGVPHAHNVFLQMGFDTGIPGLLAYLAIVLLAARECANLVRRASPLYAALGMGGLATLVASHVYGVVDVVALGAKPGVLWWGLLAFIVALRYVAEREGSKDVAPPPPAQSPAPASPAPGGGGG